MPEPSQTKLWHSPPLKYAHPSWPGAEQLDPTAGGSAGQAETVVPLLVPAPLPVPPLLPVPTAPPSPPDSTRPPHATAQVTAAMPRAKEILTPLLWPD
jgi:hypothetical protein